VGQGGDRSAEEIPPLVDVLPPRWAQNGVIPRTVAIRQHSMRANSAVLETPLRHSKPHKNRAERPRPATQIGVALMVTSMTIATLGLLQRESSRNGTVGIHFETAFGSVSRKTNMGTRRVEPTTCPFAHLDHMLSACSAWGERPWPSPDARFSFRKDTRQQRDIPREAGARRTYLLESSLVAHGLPFVRTSQFRNYQGALQGVDPAALRGRIESEHLAEAALESLAMLPVCDTCATHEGDPT
jgi:hypothetical protein